MSRRCIQRSWVLAIFVAVGCGSGGPPQVAPVRGTVMYQGKPLAKVRVQFIPEQETGDKFLTSIAVTKADGTFELLCDDGRPGAVIGWHKVVIASLGRDADREGNPFEPPPKTGGPRPAAPPPLNLSLYTSVATTPERQEVKPGDNTIDFKLK